MSMHASLPTRFSEIQIIIVSVYGPATEIPKSSSMEVCMRNSSYAHVRNILSVQTSLLPLQNDLKPCKTFSSFQSAADRASQASLSVKLNG